MKTLTVLFLTVGGLIWFFQNDFDIKTCEYVNVENDKLLVCPDKRFRAALGFYKTTVPHAIVLRSTDPVTIDHECMHYVLYKYVGEDMRLEKIQHKLIHDHQLCNAKIEALTKIDEVAKEMGN